MVPFFPRLSNDSSVSLKEILDLNVNIHVNYRKENMKKKILWAVEFTKKITISIYHP